MRHIWWVVVLAATAALAAPEPAPVTARVRSYTVKPDLSNVSNRKQLPNLTADQRQALVANAFVARPTREEQLFYLYEYNNYKDIPSFVTTDSVLHTYHVFYDFTLRWLEQAKLAPVVADLTRRLYDVNAAALKADHPAAVRDALQRNLIYFAVPLRLLGGKADLPADCAAAVETELRRIAKHADRGKTLNGATLDYTMFVPRGHYTRSDALKRFFQAMSWYGQVPLPLKDDGATLQALILTQQLADPAIHKLWETIYEPTSFFVGRSDDLSARDYAPLVTKVFGDGSIDRFADADKRAQFVAAGEQTLPAPRIAQEMLVDGQETTQGREFHFMGQRFIPDSRILQELSYPKVGTRPQPREVPMGLDVMAVLGSARAAQLLDQTYQQTKFANYLEQRQKQQAELAALTPAEWQQNLYYGWLYSVQPLLRVRPEGYPVFMRNTAWQDKSLITALGSWTELRHDTILYGKQSVAEAGSGEEPPIAGYVEPEVEVYQRLGDLLKLTRDGLAQRGLITLPKTDQDEVGPVVQGLNDFIGSLGTLTTISRKELAGQQLSEDELGEIKWFGATLEGLMMTAARMVDDANTPRRWWQIESKTDRNMALVADVHTSKGSVLEEAVGPAAELWVIVPFKDRLVAARGAMFSWYEFLHDADDRLTDEAWQAMLAKDGGPAPAPWVGQIIRRPGLTKPVAYEDLGE